jgi:hypothetical protein
LSQLLDCGHTQAASYPIGVVWDENQLIVDRVNRQHATNAIMMQAVMSAAVGSFGKNGAAAAKALDDKIREMSGNGADE